MSRPIDRLTLRGAAGAGDPASVARVRPADTRRLDVLRGRRVLFVVNVDWFFLSHRVALARAARDSGAEVWVAAGHTGLGSRIRSEGFEFVALPLSRKGTEPLAELRILLFLLRLYRRLRPDLVHHVTVKPVLYGSLVARLFPGMAVVNAISGLGYLFSGGGRSNRLRRLMSGPYHLALNRSRSRTIFQNPDDFAYFVRQGFLPEEQAVLIRGSGVDCDEFREAPLPAGVPVVMLPARMLRDKGVQTFVEAASTLRGRIDARFVLVGSADPDNPNTISPEQLQAWDREGIAEWWGHREDMPSALAEATLVVLPSHGEGLPKVLLEAAAVGRPLLSTNVRGCREIVRHGVNGLLVPPGDAIALAEAIVSLLESPGLLRQYGRAGREMVEREFTTDLVAARTLEVYRDLLGAPNSDRVEGAA